MASESDVYLSARKASGLLGVSQTTVLAWFNDGVFPNGFRIKGVVRIPVTDLEAAKQRPFDKPADLPGTEIPKGAA